MKNIILSLVTICAFGLTTVGCSHFHSCDKSCACSKDKTCGCKKDENGKGTCEDCKDKGK